MALVEDRAAASFNRISIDGDTSTNGSLVRVASQRAGHAPLTSFTSADGRALREAAGGAGGRPLRLGARQPVAVWGRVPTPRCTACEAAALQRMA
jgi:hypothetical protein